MEVKHFEFLDELRESGETNMWGATPYITKEFGISNKEAKEILFAWMETFDFESTAEERIQKARAKNQ